MCIYSGGKLPVGRLLVARCYISPSASAATSPVGSVLSSLTDIGPTASTKLLMLLETERNYIIYIIASSKLLMLSSLL